MGAGNDQGHEQGQGHEHLIHYEVDDEPQATTEKVLTPEQIMSYAGLDPKAHYLELILNDHKTKSYKENPNEEIHMRENMVFLTKPFGPMPVS